MSGDGLCNGAPMDDKFSDAFRTVILLQSELDKARNENARLKKLVGNYSELDKARNENARLKKLVDNYSAKCEIYAKLDKLNKFLAAMHRLRKKMAKKHGTSRPSSDSSLDSSSDSSSE